jgi:hypothetical protein
MHQTAEIPPVAIDPSIVAIGSSAYVGPEGSHHEAHLQQIETAHQKVLAEQTRFVMEHTVKPPHEGNDTLPKNTPPAEMRARLQQARKEAGLNPNL